MFVNAISNRSPLLLAAMVLASWSSTVQAQNLADEPSRPLWEAGIAVLGLHAPDYPAAATHHWRGAVAPVFIYRGKRLRVDGDGIRGRLIDTGRLELDLSGAAAFNSRQSPARQGMPERDYTFELGPQLIYRVPLAEGQQISGHLKVRAVISTDFRDLHGRGHVVEPEVRYQKRGWPDAASVMQLSAQATWASEKLQDYFYQVDPEYSTPTRPAYDARAGHFASALRAGLSRRINPTTLVNISTGVQFHGGAANAASPLFQRRTTGSVFVAVVWTPLRGGETEP